MLIHPVVDGVEREVEVDPWESLLSVLRDRVGVTAPKNACEQGECGSCSVWLDGEVVCACLVPAAQSDGSLVHTVASLSNGELHPLQRAFLDAGAVQCGFCTPGMLVAATELLQQKPEPTEHEVREGLSGNLCRCTGYQKIVEAVLSAARALR